MTIKKLSLIPLLFLFLFSCASTGPVSGTAKKDPFKPLTDYVESNDSWLQNHDEQAVIFHKIRNELGKEFEEELVLFVGQDLERIYWCGIFLITETYLQAAMPDYALAVRIFDIALSLEFDPGSENWDEMSNIASQTSIKINYAIIAYKMGNYKKAAALKQEVETLFKEFPIYRGAIPAMYEKDREIYMGL